MSHCVPVAAVARATECAGGTTSRVKINIDGMKRTDITIETLTNQ